MKWFEELALGTFCSSWDGEWEQALLNCTPAEDYEDFTHDWVVSEVVSLANHIERKTKGIEDILIHVKNSGCDLVCACQSCNALKILRELGYE